jgi:general secretion pathway protein I
MRTGAAGEGGFGLLEAIVALVILGTSGLALFSWLQQNLQDASRLRRADAQARLMLNAQALVETVNPSAQPEGVLRVGGIEVQWHAELVEPARNNQTFGRDVGPWIVGLYRVTVEAIDASNDAKTKFTQLSVGTRRDAPPGTGQ